MSVAIMLCVISVDLSALAKAWSVNIIHVDYALPFELRSISHENKHEASFCLILALPWNKYLSLFLQNKKKQAVVNPLCCQRYRRASLQCHMPAVWGKQITRHCTATHTINNSLCTLRNSQSLAQFELCSLTPRRWCGRESGVSLLLWVVCVHVFVQWAWH